MSGAVGGSQADQAAPARAKSVAVGTWRWATLCALCCLTASGVALAQVQTLPPRATPPGSVQSLPIDNASRPIYAVGTASIIDGNTQKARSAALRAAYAEAVARGAGMQIDSMTLVKNVQQVIDVISSRSSGFITSYDIAHEGAEGQVYTVGINAQVAVRELSDEEQTLAGLRLYLQVYGRPTVLVLFPQYDTIGELAAPATTETQPFSKTSRSTQDGERSTESSEETFVLPGSGYQAVPGTTTLAPGMLRGTEAAVAQELSRFGYQLKTSDDVAISSQVSATQLSRARQGLTQEALQVGRAVGADLVIVGSLQVSGRAITTHNVDFQQASGEAAMKAISMKTGETISIFQQNATRAGSNLLQAAGAVKKQIAIEFAKELAWAVPRMLAEQQP